MTNVQMVIIILMFIVTAVGAYSTGKQAGRREIAKHLAEVLAKGIGEVSEAFKRFIESGEEDE